ncbi:MAG: tetratricopeptide repeat protein [Chlorobi bacterium]|nr:tetratricopeptide repeat protein [Chlorobiota bacterium]
MKQFTYIFLLNFLFVSYIILSQTTAKIDSVNQIPYEYIVSHLKESVTTFEKNVALAQEVNYKYGEAVALDKLALAKGMSGEHTEATNAILRAARIFEKLNKFNELSMVYGGYGYGAKRRDIETANMYMRMGIGIAEKHDLDTNLTTLYDNYGVLKKMEGKNDSAYYFFSRALKIKRKIGDSVGIPYSLNKLAEMLSESGNYNKALAFMAESDAIRNKEKGEFGRAENLIYYGEIYRSMKNYKKAIHYYKQAIRKGKPLHYKYMVQYAYQQLAELYERTDRYADALENYKFYTVYKDSLNNAEMNNKIAELQIEYETEKKDRQLTEQALELKNKSLQLIIAIVSFVFISVIFFVLYKGYKQKQRHLRDEMQLHNQIKHNELEQKFTREKLRLSQELHDNIGSNLTFIINAMDNLKNIDDSKLLQEKINGVNEFGRDTINDLRNTIWALNFDKGDTSLLVMKVQDLRQKLNESLDKPEIMVENHMKNTIQLSSTEMLNLYRMIQEALQNAIKHANANRATVIFSNTESQLIINVVDDGNGFDPQTVKFGNGFKNMRNRCKTLLGKFSFESSSKGTILSFAISKK